jgi:hypothetical protein
LLATCRTKKCAPVASSQNPSGTAENKKFEKTRFHAPAPPQNWPVLFRETKRWRYVGTPVPSSPAVGFQSTGPETLGPGTPAVGPFPVASCRPVHGPPQAGADSGAHRSRVCGTSPAPTASPGPGGVRGSASGGIRGPGPARG